MHEGHTMHERRTTHACRRAGAPAGPVSAMLLIFSLIVVLAAAGCAGAARGDGDRAGAPDATVVETVPVIREDISFPIHTAGMVELKERVKLAFKVGGIVSRILVDEGDAVAAGQLLARLDLSEIEARVHKARSAYEKAQRDLERVRSLYQDRVVPLEQLQDAETARDIARSDLEVVEFNLEHSVIRAPARGKILGRFAEAGELVASGTPVLLFATTEKNWILRFGVIDRDMVRLQRGDPADVRFDVYPGRVLSAAVSEIAETADPRTGTFEVELSLEPEPGYPLVSGFIAKVDIHPRSTRRLALVPLQSLVEGEGREAFVFTVDPQTSAARRIPVTIHRIVDDRAAVGGGLDDVDAVIATGAAYLRDGEPVRVSRRGPVDAGIP